MSDGTVEIKCDWNSDNFGKPFGCGTIDGPQIGCTVRQNLVISMCVFYYCRTYYKAVRVGGGGEWRTCAMRDDEPRPVWMSSRCRHPGLNWGCHGHNVEY
jgi:hypothetical protein